MLNFFVEVGLILILRPESHDQVFLHNFLALVVWKVVQVYVSLLRAPVDNFISQPCENENQNSESLDKFLWENKIKLYFSSKFFKRRQFSTIKSKLLVVFLKIFSGRIQNKTAAVNAKKKRMRHNYQAKM